MAGDNQSPELFGQTPWQTVGPFFHYGLPWKGCADLVGDLDLGARTDLFPAAHYVMKLPAARQAVVGDVIEVFGQVRDGEGQPVPDALLEIWQADGAGVYNSPNDPRAARSNHGGFSGFGRSCTSQDGMYRFRTLRPGATPGLGGIAQAPHIAIGVFGRGLIKRLSTRLYFADSADLDADPILSQAPAERRRTLIANPEAGGWRFDIVLQGADETVFFEF